MNTTLFMPSHILASGFFVGIIFGFLLRKGYVTKFDVIVNQFLFRDFTVMKVILTATLFGGISMYGITYFMPHYSLVISKTTLLSSAIGGAIFGIGMAIMGYCPGTGIGALADGARDMWFGMLGMVTGAALYAQVYPWIACTIKPEADMNRITLPELLGLPAWLILIGIALILAAVAWFDRK